MEKECLYIWIGYFKSEIEMLSFDIKSEILKLNGIMQDSDWYSVSFNHDIQDYVNGEYSIYIAFGNYRQLLSCDEYVAICFSRENIDIG